MPYPINHISYSSLQLWHTCRWCFKAKYIDKLIPDQQLSLEEGKKYHIEVHRYHSHQDFDKDYIAPYTAKYPVDYREASEIEFLAPFQHRCYTAPLKVLGYLDGTRGNEIVDLKYGNSRPQTKHNIQGILYTAMFKKVYGTYPLFTFNWVNKKNNQVKNLSVQYTSKDIDWLVREVIKPFFKDLEDYNKVFLTGRYGFHAYPGVCPFSV